MKSLFMKINYLNFLFIGLLLISAGSAYAQSLLWAKGIGGGGADYGNDVVTDAAGNIYITGYFSTSADFDSDSAILNLISNGGHDMLLTKYNSAGNLLWVKSIGGVGSDWGTSVALDLYGNIFIVGHFSDTVDFDSGTGTNPLISSGGIDIFLAKYDSSGNYLWANSIGGAGGDFAKEIAIDIMGNVYLTGYFEQTVYFNPSIVIDSLITFGHQDIFLAKYHSSGTYLWANQVGGLGIDFGNSLTTDISGNVYLSGQFEFNLYFHIGGGPTLASHGGLDIFIVKYDSMGSYLWAKNFGGSGSDVGNCVIVDSLENVYLAGYFNNTLLGTGLTTLISSGMNDGLLLKLDANGNYLWGAKLGGAADDISRSIALDLANNLYVSGEFSGQTVFETNTGTINLLSSGGKDVFLAKYDSSGFCIWANAIGGTGNEGCGNLHLDIGGNVFIAGSYEGVVDFDAGIGLKNMTSLGSVDIFVTKYKELTTDAGINLLSPVGTLPSTGSTVNVQVVIYNCGFNILTSAEIGYQINNGIPVIANWSGSLTREQSDTFTFNTNLLIPNQNFTLKTWIQNPNNSGSDLNSSNDTTSRSYCLSLAGNYTIGGLNANFLTFQQAVDAINCGGISAPVTFQLFPGNYGGGYILEFDGDFGLTIISQTGNAGDVYFGGILNGASIRLRRISNVNLEAISIVGSATQTDTRYGIAVDNSSNVKISRCIINDVSGNHLYSTMLIHISGASDSILINNNEFKEADYGVFSFGSGIRSGIYITDNYFTDIYHTPISLQGQSTSIPIERIYIQENVVNNQNIPSVNTSGRGFSLTNTTNFSISNNFIFGKLGFASLYLSNFSNTGPDMNRVFNNIFDVSFSDLVPKAILLAGNAAGGSDYVEIYYNTFKVQVTSNTTTHNGAFYVQGGTPSNPAINGIKFKNNVLQVSSGDTSGHTPPNFRSWYIALAIQRNVLESSNNDYFFPTASEFARVNSPATNFDSLSTWQSNSGLDSNSFQTDPLFSSPELIPMLTSPLRYAATIIPIIGLDINGYLRSSLLPTIGANELCETTYQSITREICSGSSITFGGQALSTAGSYNHLYTASNGGCDSVINLTLLIAPPDSTQLSASICQGDIYMFASQNLTIAGYYHHTFSTAAGCDSVVSLSLSVNSLLSTTVSATICAGNSYSFGGQTITTAGTYQDTLISLNGCDSVVTLTLSVYPVNQTSAAAGICPGNSYLFGGQNLTTAGTYNHTYQNVLGCDSNVTLVLSINPIHQETATVGFCLGGTYQFGSQTLSLPGTFLHTFQNSSGCDSVVTLTLFIDSSLSPTANRAVAICAGNSYTFAGQQLTTAGSYTALISATGCDSLITLNLSIHSIDTAVTVSQFTLLALADSNTSAYQWLNCATNSLIANATNRQYTVTVNGSYAAIVTQNGCTDTSSCYEIIGVGIAEPAGLKALQLYPNPANGLVYLSFELEKATTFQLKVRDSRGRLVYERQHSETQGSTVLELPLEQLAEGIYTILLETPQGTAIRKLVKTK